VDGTGQIGGYLAGRKQKGKRIATMGNEEGGKNGPKAKKEFLTRA